MNRRNRLALILLLAVQPSAVTLGQTIASAEDIATLADDADARYHIQPGDVLEISVWSEPELQREVLVAPDGGFSFPLAGEVIARDKTVSDLREEIGERLSQYLADPLVTVTLSEVLGNKIYVIGQVASPGAFVVNPHVDVMQALSMAGGATAYASLKDIVILRRSGPEQVVLDFRYSDVAAGQNLDQNIVLQSGDVVVVP